MNVGLCKLINGVMNQQKTARGIYMRTLDIAFERDRSIGLDSTFGDGHKKHKNT